MQPIHWETPEYEHKEKSADWYWALGIIAVSSAVTSFILGNILFAIFILLGAFLLALFASREPNIINCEIDERGVVIGSTLYPYQTLESFWVEETLDGRAKLILQSRKTFMQHIIIPIAEISPDEVREFLLDHLEEKEMSEPLSQRLMELFGF